MSVTTRVLLDHLVLRVRSLSESIRFYQEVLGFRHEGSDGPFEVIRVNEQLILDLIAEPPRDKLHLALALARADFEAVVKRLIDQKVPYGNGPFARDGGPPAK